MAGIASILLIKPGESRQVAYFMLLLVLLGAGMAIGRGSADVLFLKRYGIEYLPVMYMLLSVALALCFTLYAAFVDRISSERFFYFLLVIEILVLLAFWVSISFAEVQSVYPAYYIFYELVSELILVHATFYIAQSLDTLQSKRLTSLILAGYQLGMIIGGLFFAMLMPYLGVQHAMLVWSGLLLLSLAMLLSWHRRHGVSPFFIPPSKKSGNQIRLAIQEVGKGLQFVRQSSLLKYSSLALFFMVLMFYVLTYSVNKIYTESFASEAELAMFFGMLVAATNFLAVILQALVSGRVVEKIGVRKAKLIYPLMTVVSYALLLVSPGFYMALIASTGNSAIMPAFRNPVRQMFFNVLPDYMKGRARATSVALVLPLALFVCGLLILYLQSSQNPVLIIYFGFVCALLYLFFCYRMGKVYSATLIENLRKKLYLPDNLSRAAYRGNNHSLYPLLVQGLASENLRVCLSHAELLLETFPETSVAAIMQRIKTAATDLADRLVRLIASEADASVLVELMALNTVIQSDNRDDHLRATIYDVVLEYGAQENTTLIETTLASSHHRIRLAGIKAALRKNEGELYQRGLNAWYEMLDGDWSQQMTVIDMQPLLAHVNAAHAEQLKMRYSKLFESLLCELNSERRYVIYQALAKWRDMHSAQLPALIRRDMRHVDPALRMAVASCLYALADDQIRNEYIWTMLGDGHAGVRQAALQVLEKLSSSAKEIYVEWLLAENAGAPRAQTVLLEALISHGAEHEQLKQIADMKSVYASHLLSALSRLEQADTAAIRMLRTVLEERLTEMIDLVLLAMTPNVEAGLIAVIRAGLSSKDAATIASAHEALQGIDDKQLVALLSALIDRKQEHAVMQGYAKYFLNSREVVQWCLDVGDAWLRECADYALMTMDEKIYA